MRRCDRIARCSSVSATSISSATTSSARSRSGKRSSSSRSTSTARVHHLALTVESRDDVDAVHDAAVAAGAQILHEPRLWPEYHPEYYATFFEDPDGFRIEVAASR